MLFPLPFKHNRTIVICIVPDAARRYVITGLRPYIIILSAVLQSSVCLAQELPAEDAVPHGQPSWESVFVGMMAEEDEEAEAWEDMYDLLGDMAEHPMDINTATREDLERLPFLNARQIEEICEYLYRYGPMRSAAELQLIESLDYNSRRLLRCMIYIGDGVKQGFPAPGDMLKYGKHTLIATAKMPFYDRKGDRNGYLGYKYKHWFRYDFAYADRLRCGLVGSQDAGEPFFSAGNGAGYDFYSFYLQMKNTGRMENLTVGRYRLSSGMGLVLGSSFNLGKASVISRSGRGTNAIRVHSSRSEADYFQGAAAAVRVAKGLTVGAFASFRPLDATLNADGTARTIVTTGYHRTIAEMKKKGNTHATAAGANVRYAAGGFHAGATAVYTHLDRDLMPLTSTLYRRYYPSGNDFVNTSADYGYICHRLSVNGETAIDRHGAVATANSVSVAVGSELGLTLLQRFYSYRYTSLYAGGFADGGEIRNESGIYLGADWHPSELVKISAYTDYASFPWARYRISQSSHSSDNMLSAVFTSRRWTFGARYRVRLRQRDNDRKTALMAYNTHRVRLHAVYDADGRWSSRTQVDFALTEYKKRERGWMVSENVNCKLKWLQLNLSANYFRTDSYESRLYAYERTLLYSFSFPAFYGHGIRYAVMARADFGRRLMLTARLGVTDYFDRSTIGSSYQTIYASSAAELEVQARIKF